MITLLFLDFTGTLHAWFGWMARVQLLPAVLAVNVAVVAALLVLTLLFGRVYCSVICPLGVFQDVASWAGGKRRKNRFTYSRALPWLRYGMLALFVAAMVAHIKPVAELLAPYSAYGRIASNLFAPLYRWGNNLLAYAAERIDSYAFYTVDVWVKSGVTFAVAAATFAVLSVLAWRNGRTYCNTVCPVGTLLGFVSRFAVFKPRIDTSKCNGCGLARATARPRASTPSRTKSTTAVVWPAWTVSANAVSTPSPFRANRPQNPLRRPPRPQRRRLRQRRTASLQRNLRQRRSVSSPRTGPPTLRAANSSRLPAFWPTRRP